MAALVGSAVSANANVGEITFEAGYRHDNIDWEHSFPASSPDIKHHTKFKDVDIFQIALNGRSTIGCNFYVRGGAYWGWVLDGKFENSFDTYGSSSFIGNDSFQGSCFRKNIIDDRYVYGFNAAIGYPFYFCDCSLILAPVVGYALDEQTFRVERRDFDFYGYGLGNCCTHKFLNRWYGGFVGVDFEYRPFSQCWNVYGEIEYHWVEFSGRRNFCDDFFFNNRHNHSRGSGWVFGIGADYDISQCWTAGLSVKFQDYRAHRHRHQHFSSYDSYYSSSEGGYSGRAHESAKWHSYQINLTIGHEF